MVQIKRPSVFSNLQGVSLIKRSLQQCHVFESIDRLSFVHLVLIFVEVARKTLKKKVAPDFSVEVARVERKFKVASGKSKQVFTNSSERKSFDYIKFKVYRVSQNFSTKLVVS